MQVLGAYGVHMCPEGCPSGIRVHAQRHWVRALSIQCVPSPDLKRAESRQEGAPWAG